MRLVAAMMAVALAAVPGWAQPRPEVPDEIAYRILFQLMRTRPEGAWDDKTQLLWLEKRGVPLRFFLPLRLAADRYWRAVAPFERDLRDIHSRFAGRNDSPEAVAAARPANEKISEQMKLTVRDLEAALEADGTPHLRRLLEEIRKGTRRAGVPGGQGGGHAH